MIHNYKENEISKKDLMQQDILNSGFYIYKMYSFNVYVHRKKYEINLKLGISIEKERDYHIRKVLRYNFQYKDEQIDDFIYFKIYKNKILSNKVIIKAIKERINSFFSVYNVLLVKDKNTFKIKNDINNILDNEMIVWLNKYVDKKDYKRWIIETYGL